jgi:carbon-monoxide dehydrogenase small subunit
VDVDMTVNGAEQHLTVEPRRLLADVLRDDLGLTGTHLGCEHGVCGACTVLVDGRAVRSCLLLAVQCAGRSVTTVEGLAGDDGPHPMQLAFSSAHALQCGFCTPGFLMLAVGAVTADPTVVHDPDRLRELLTSNLCRCTGYEPIRAAVVRAVASGHEPRGRHGGAGADGNGH